MSSSVMVLRSFIQEADGCQYGLAWCSLARAPSRLLLMVGVFAFTSGSRVLTYSLKYAFRMP